MAENLVINEVTYPEVKAISVETTEGEQAMYYPDAVRYTEQTLTEAQQEQARTNIAAASAAEVSQLSEEIVDQQDWFTNEIINVAHRGAMPTEAPENTLVAYAKAAEMGFDYVEVDIRLTSDGEIVMSHDATINRMARNKDGSTLSASINVADVTYSKLQQYVFCGSLYGTYPSVKIPTL